LCGGFIDLIRYRYRARFRARFGDDDSIFEGDWQFINPGAKAISFETAFGSNHTDPEHSDGGQVGEVRQIFYPKAQTYLPGFLLGNHICGTQQQWQNGWAAGVEGSPIVAGVPTCCTDDEGAAFDTGFDFGFES